MGIIMTYSINDLTSFQSLENWLRQIKTHANEDVVKILVGNKCDVADRKVSYEEAKKMAEQFGV
jgi:Ras-related protein Rab-8A